MRKTTIIALFLLLIFRIADAALYQNGPIFLQTLPTLENFGVAVGDQLFFYYGFTGNDYCRTLDGGYNTLVLKKGSVIQHDFKIPCGSSSGGNHTISWTIPTNFALGNDYKLRFVYYYRPNSSTDRTTYLVETNPFVIGKDPNIVYPKPGAEVPNLTPTFQWEKLTEAENYGLIIGGKDLSYNGSNFTSDNAIHQLNDLSLSQYKIPEGVLKHGTTYKWIAGAKMYGIWFSSVGTFKTAANKAPVASFTMNPNTGNFPLTVNLDASASSDPDGKIVSYQWNSSDGQVATGQQANLTFNQAGEYTITLTVTDDYGATATQKKVLIVTTPRYDLSLSKSGSGSGTITSSPAGINCGNDCSESYNQGTSVTLTATPVSGSIFTGWNGGGCSGTGNCVVTMNNDLTVTATFQLIQKTLSINKSGTGSGNITSSPAGINCGSDCSETYNQGTSVTLTATPVSGSTFSGWSGGNCSGTGNCVVTMNNDLTVTATFKLIQKTLSITKSGTGSGKVTSSPIGINCGSDCREDYNKGTLVTLTATPESGSTFESWSGECSGTGTCQVSMTDNKNVIAIFGGKEAPPATTLISPKNTIKNSTPTYTWNAVSNSTWYYLWVNKATKKKFTKWYKASDAGCSNGTGECKVTPNISLANGDYKWWIQTWNSNGYGPWSSGMDFTLTGVGGPPIAATLVSPKGTISDPTPSYTWNAVSNATWYYLWVKNDTGPVFKKWYKAVDAQCSGGTGQCKITPAKNLANGKHTWWIQTWNSNGYGQWSNSMIFTITGAGEPPVATTLVSPIGTISERTPTYVWKAVSNSTWYYLWVNTGKAKKFAKWYQASDTGCGNGKGFCAITPSTSLANGQHSWWVQTWNANGYGAWSSGMDFNVQAGTNNATNFISELNLATPIKLGEELEVNLIIYPNSAHIGKQADLILVLEYWPTAAIEDRISFYRDVNGKWQIWTGEALPPKTRTYEELPALIKETISLGVLELRGKYRWYAAYVLTDGTVVSSSEPLVFVIE